MESKVCTKCKKEKQLSEFYIRCRTSNKKTYIFSICKECENKASADFQKTDKRKEWRRQYRKKNKEKNTLKRSAWTLLNASISRGNTIRPSQCSQCDSTHRIQAHHEDYTKPLDVMWLCELCHKKRHRDKNSA